MHRCANQREYLPGRTWIGTDAKVVRHIRVHGCGHLAAAVRIELVRLGISRESDYLLAALHPALLIACGDRETDPCFDEAATRAAEQASPLLLACLNGHFVRIGPLVEPAKDCGPPMICPPEKPATAETVDAHETGLAHETRIAEADPRSSLYARLGALLVGAQALSFLMGTRSQCVLDRVVELNPWSIESRSYKLLKVRQ